MKSDTPSGVGSNGSSTIRVVKDRAGQVLGQTTGTARQPLWATMRVRSDPETGDVNIKLSADADSGDPDHAQIALRTIHQVMSKQDGLSLRSVTEAAGMGNSTARRAVNMSVEIGIVAMKLGPRNSQLHSIVDRAAAARLLGESWVLEACRP